MAVWIVAAAMVAAGCASNFETVPMEQVPFLERAVEQEKDGVRVRVAVPSAKETKQLFGAPLYSRGIQPVWLEFENNTDTLFSYLPVGTDPDYFSPIEAATVFSTRSFTGAAEKFYFENGMPLYIDAGETRKGFIFTNLDEGTKAMNIDLVAPDESRDFTFFVEVPGLRIDHTQVDFANLYGDGEFRNFDEPAAFAAAIAELPCCTTDSEGVEFGDPLNLVFIGSPFEMFHAMIQSGWDETETVTLASGVKTALSFFTGGEYRYSPVSSLYVFGRSQDAAFQKIRKNIHERNHLRVWLAPMTFRGRQVWIGQISRDIGVRFTTKTITTHKIDPDVDETRSYLMENLAYNQSLAGISYLWGVGSAPPDAPRGNLTGDPYFTDGRRVVLWLTADANELDDIDFYDWTEFAPDQ